MEESGWKKWEYFLYKVELCYMAAPNLVGFKKKKRLNEFGEVLGSQWLMAVGLLWRHLLEISGLPSAVSWLLRGQTAGRDRPSM